MDATLASILDSLGKARRFAEPGAPIEARLMAARGALPVPPPEIAGVLFALTFDPEPEVKARALESLEGLPERMLDAALSAPLHPALLAFFAERLREDLPRLETLALNPATSDETYCLIAAAPSARLVEIVSQNQTRLLRCPALVDALAENPLTSQATIDRVLEFLGIEVGDRAEPEEVVPEVPEPLDADRQAAPFDPDDVSGIPEDLLLEDENEASEADEDEERTRSLLSIIQGMSVMEKIKLARVGNGEARGLLVRDRNKIVAQAVIRSPKLTENEVMAFAKSRNLCDDVLRIIAGTREWTKSYAIKLALATNPKAPVGHAIKFLNYLTDRDLRSIMRSRDVSGQISTQARRILMKKGKL